MRREYHEPELPKYVIDWMHRRVEYEGEEGIVSDVKRVQVEGKWQTLVNIVFDDGRFRPGLSLDGVRRLDREPRP